MTSSYELYKLDEDERTEFSHIYASLCYSVKKFQWRWKNFAEFPDVVQESYLRILKYGLDTIEVTLSYAVEAVVKQTIIAMYHKSTRQVRCSYLSDIIENLNSFGYIEDYHKKVGISPIEHFIRKKLPDREAWVVLQHDLEGRTFGHIALEYGCTEQGVHLWYKSAVKRLHKILERESIEIGELID